MRIRNWKKFQHFKDRRPPWIKLYRDLLDDMDWFNLEPESAKGLISIWLIASENDGFVPEGKPLSFRLRLPEKQTQRIIDELYDKGFLVDSDEIDEADPSLTPVQRIAKSNGYGSRYIPDEIKRQVMLRDGGICVTCKSPERIEFDHIHPVSKGGESTIENIQLLCRPCNRKKRARLAALSPDATCAKRSPETEVEKEREVERRHPPPFTKPTIQEVRAYCIARKNQVNAERFLNHYEANGWRVGRNPMRDWQAAIRTWEQSEFNQGVKSAGTNSTTVHDHLLARADREKDRGARVEGVPSVPRGVDESSPMSLPEI